VQHHGITLTGLADFTVPVAVTTQPQAVREADVLIVTVKTYDTETALASVSHLQVGSVLSVQNGVLKDEQLARTFGEDKTLGAAVVLSGEVTPAGPVRFTLNEYFAIGELPAGTSERVQALVSALARAGLRAEASPHIRSVEWSKYAFFLSWMAPALLTRQETYKFLSHPDSAVVVAQLIQETGLLAARLNIPLDDRGSFPIKTLCSISLADAVTIVRGVGETMATQAPAHKISTLQDLERGRCLEFAETLGYAARQGAELGVPLPTITACYRLIAPVHQALQ
jgi:2-dehydropantoate 2-reductase